MISLSTDNAIAIIMPILVYLLTVRKNAAEEKMTAKKNPIMTPFESKKTLSQTTPDKSWLQRTWVVFLIESIIVIFLIIEVTSGGGLTKIALYKIVFLTGAFFFILIQSSISNLARSIFQTPDPGGKV